MSRYGFGEPLLSWFKSYLTNRSQYVVVKGFSSDTYSTPSGIPQGSHIGPLLFNIFINDIVDVIHYSDIFLYADDLKLARVIKDPEDARLLQLDLDSVAKWCRNNKMSLNADKCYHIKITRKSQIFKSHYIINEAILKEEDTIRDVGITIDAKLTYIPHMDDIISRASRSLGFIIRNCKVFLNPWTKIIIYNSFVRSTLEYCSIVWSPSYQIHQLRIERIQKRFLRHLTFSSGLTKKLTSYKDRLRHFNMVSLVVRRNILDIIFLYKVVRNLIDCPNILNKINFRVPRKIPRYPVPLFNTPCARTNIRAHAALCRLPEAYNKISKEIDIFHESPRQFRNKLLSLMTGGDGRI